LKHSIFFQFVCEIIEFLTKITIFFLSTVNILGGNIMNPMQQQQQQQQQQHMMQNMRMPTNPAGVLPQQPPGQMPPQQAPPGQPQQSPMQGVQSPIPGGAPGNQMAPVGVQPQVGGQQQIPGQQPQGQMMPGMQQQQQQQQQQAAARERHNIWSGTLEWIEKSRNSDAQKTTRHVPCVVSANTKDGEPEL
jgi:mediator of RNA polymerase II transcription subunit 25